MPTNWPVIGDDMHKIKLDIKRARVYIKQRFKEYVDEETTPSFLSIIPVYSITFPEPDSAILLRISFGNELHWSSAREYKLCWLPGGALAWKGGPLSAPRKHLLYVEG